MKLTVNVASLALGALPIMAYVPEPQPVKSAVEITALYYPGTEHMPEWDMVAQTRPEIKPLLGWYDEGSPEVIDWQIKWAVEHGISSFCVDWYWNKGRRRLEHWVKGYYRARYRKHLKWYMMYANHNQPGAHSTEDQVAVTKYWIDNYFKTPEYYTIDGKPVVCYWAPGNLDRDFIAEAAAKGEKLKEGEGISRAFAISEKMAKEAGLPGIHWQKMGGGGGLFSSGISYGFIPKPQSNSTALTYDMVMEGISKRWSADASRWLPIPTGWDDRPRSFKYARVIKGRTPEKFAAICREARAFCDRNGLSHVIIHPINEWQEGSYIEPNEEWGFGMYDAIRDAFCEKPAAGWPPNLRPSDVGLGPYDYPPSLRSSVQRWDFGSSTEGWYRQPYGGGEVENHDGCLTFVVTRRRNYNIRQCVKPFDAAKYRTFRIRMKITPNAQWKADERDISAMRLKWGTAERPIIGPGLAVDGKRSIAQCPVKADGEFHEYALDLSANPDWKGMVDELWFEACQIMHARVAIDWMRFERGAEKTNALCGSAVADTAVRMIPCGEAQVATVQAPPMYNSWPMVQALGGGKVVCAYSRGSAHTVSEGRRGVYARTSTDGGRTWGAEVCVCNMPEWGEVTVGKGRDDSGAMLLWIRRVDRRGWGPGTFHDFWRTVDGATWEKIASPELDPHPIQVTDVVSVPGKGLMSLWFAGSYGNKTGGHSWGTLTSADGGRTWTQRTVEADLAKADWPTEQSAVHLGGGRILAIARSEGGAGAQFQLTSTDGGETWKRARTNIKDVRESTPSLIFDPQTGLVYNYYYQRGAKKLKRRVADAAFIFGRPTAWPDPETLAEGNEERAWDAGNVNAAACGDRHLLALYTGTTKDSAVFAVSVPVPSAPVAHPYVVEFDVSSQTATGGLVNVSVPGVMLLDATLPQPGRTYRYARAFRSTPALDAGDLTMGRWMVKGECSSGQPSLTPVTPVYVGAPGMEMGAGERLMGHAYSYFANLHTRFSNLSRPFMAAANGYYHQSQWRMQKDGALLWRHELGGRRFTNAKAKLGAFNVNGLCAVEAAADGGPWRRVATFTNKVDKFEVVLPDGTNIQVCVCGTGAGGFTLHSYSFEAHVDTAPAYSIGRTDILRADGTPYRWPDEPEKPYAQGARLASTDGALRLWTAAAGWKVFPENPLPPETARTDAVRIQTAANETECAQLVVTPTRTLEGVRVDVADMKGIPPSSVEVLCVSYVDVRVPTDKTCASGLWPDPIERQTAAGRSVAADESLAFWVRVKPPKGTKPGVYRGALELRAEGCAVQRVPLEVGVFGFELPDAMTCETAFGCNAWRISRACRLKTEEDRRRALPAYFRILGEHHISVYDPNPTVPLKVTWKGMENPATAEPSFNWDEWDAGIERSLKEWHMNTVRVPVKGLGGGTYQNRWEPKIAGFKGGTPEYETLMGRYLGAVEAHMKEKGWLSRSYVYWFDEPEPKDYEFVSNGFAHLKRYAPGIRRMLTEQVEPELMDGVNLWCPVSHCFHRTDRTAALARGDTFWWYVCCGPKAPYATEFVDKPGTELRVWLWQTWKEGIAGVLIWETVYWDGGCVYRDRSYPQDCWEDPQSWCDCTPVGWGNGDGRFLYPPRAARDRARKDPVLDPPVETYRLEMLRDGLEDYEYLAILRRLDPSNALLAVPPEVTASMTEFTRDPAPIARRREAVAREIVRLLKSRRNDS